MAKETSLRRLIERKEQIKADIERHLTDPNRIKRNTAFDLGIGRMKAQLLELENEIQNFGKIQLWQVTITIPTKMGDIYFDKTRVILYPYMDEADLLWFLRYKFPNYTKADYCIIQTGK
jgi:hypothetical protein